MTDLKSFSALAFLLVVGGCSTSREDFLVEPKLTTPGAGLYQYAPYVQPTGYSGDVARPRGNSLFNPRNSDYFRDTRALNVGDIVTVKIEIKDKAELDNNTKRSRDSAIKAGADFDGALNGNTLGTLGATLDLSNGTNTTGKGTVDRSEKIQLSVAAQVTQVLPNGNLFIAGQQEVRVNFEVRVLTIAGVIRPGDILPNNTIPYDKIAEARISYGGRGRLTEVQQPAWGQQILDHVMPY